MPRFTLKGILGVTAVLRVTLALIAAVGEPVALFCVPMVVALVT